MIANLRHNLDILAGCVQVLSRRCAILIEIRSAAAGCLSLQKIN